MSPCVAAVISGPRFFFKKEKADLFMTDMGGGGGDLAV